MRRTHLLVAALAVTLLAGCGGDEGDADGAASSTASTGTTAASPASGRLRAEADPSAAHRAPAPLTLTDGRVVGPHATDEPSTDEPGASAGGGSTVAPPATAAGGGSSPTTASASTTSTAAPPASTSTTAASSTTTTSVPAPPVDVQAIVDAYREREGIVAISAAVVRPGADGAPEVVTAASGTTSLGGPPLVTTNRFEIGSETKTFTAALLAAAVADGRIALDDPVQDHLPDGVVAPTWPGGAPMTIADLATHQAGLPDEPPNLAANDPAAKSQYTRAMLWAALPDTKLLWEPGARWLYSNYGWGLLGTILADLDQPGQTEPPFGPVVADVLTDPLGLASVELEPCDVTRCPQLPDLVVPNGPDEGPAPYWNNRGALAGGGGLVADIGDMATWVTAALGEPSAISAFATAPLQPVDAIATVCTAPTACAPSTMGFRMGLGWQLYDEAEWFTEPYAFKNGGTAGMHSTTYLVPGRRWGVTVLSSSPTPVDDLGKLLLLALDGQVTPPSG